MLVFYSYYFFFFSILLFLCFELFIFKIYNLKYRYRSSLYYSKFIFFKSNLNSRVYENTLWIYYTCFFFFLIITNYYSYGLGFNYSSSQISINNYGFYFFSFVLFIFYLLWLCRDTTKNLYFNIYDIHFSSFLLILTITSYFMLNNLFFILFIIECQGLTLLYFLFNNSPVMSSNIDYSIPSLYKYSRTLQLNQFSALFIQYWISFIFILVFIFLILRLIYLTGSVYFADIYYIRYFLFTFFDCQLLYTYIFICTSFLFIFLIKVGIFPFHFWKPLFYRGLDLWHMLCYMTILTFIYMLLFSFILCFILDSLEMLSIILYFLIFIIILVVINIIFVLVEFRLFLTYMSLFHLTYMFIFLLLNNYILFLFLWHYLIVYIIMLILFFYIILWQGGPDLQFLTDLQQFINYTILGRIFILIILIFSGLPPFISFWAKISVILILLHKAELLLSITIIFCGFLLLYYYLQNYRFFSSYHFSWSGYRELLFLQRSTIQYFYIICIFYICILYFYFLNDFLNIYYFINFIFLTDGYI